MNFFFILDTFLYEHTDFLVIVIDIVMFKNFTFCIVTYNFKELLSLSSELFVNFFHDFDINGVGGHLDIELNLFYQFN